MTRPVVCDITTAIHLHDLCSELLIRNQEVLPAGTHSESESVGMLQQEQVVVGTPPPIGALEIQCLVEADSSQPPDPKGPSVRHLGGFQSSLSQSRVWMISLTLARNAAA